MVPERCRRLLRCRFLPAVLQRIQPNRPSATGPLVWVIMPNRPHSSTIAIATYHAAHYLPVGAFDVPRSRRKRSLSSFTVLLSHRRQVSAKSSASTICLSGGGRIQRSRQGGCRLSEKAAKQGVDLEGRVFIVSISSRSPVRAQRVVFVYKRVVQLVVL